MPEFNAGIGGSEVPVNGGFAVVPFSLPMPALRLTFFQAPVFSAQGAAD
jgi:hypothetical protein